MKDIFKVILKPLITEKSSNQQADSNKYTFKADLRANKNEIKSAVEELFKVTVTRVRTCVYHGKSVRVGKSFGQKSKWKKAVVTLKEGDNIELFKGV